jgi:hypothetical protein
MGGSDRRLPGAEQARADVYSLRSCVRDAPVPTSRAKVRTDRSAPQHRPFEATSPATQISDAACPDSIADQPSMFRFEVTIMAQKDLIG